MLQLLRDFFWILFVPISWAWGFVAGWRGRRQPVLVASVPVISIGNLHSGGSGKTPLVAEISRHLHSRSPAILSRGYRARLSRTGAEVNPKSPLGIAEYGDEPWMLAKQTGVPVYIGSDRVKVLKRFNLDKRYGLLILDDGFQHRRLGRNLDIVVIPADADPEDGFCLPAGDLREPYSSLRRAHALVLTVAEDNSGNMSRWERLLEQVAPSLPRFHAIRKPAGLWDGGSIYTPAAHETFGLFCGVARPERFLDPGAHPWRTVALRAYSDHHRYTSTEIDRLISLGKEKGVSTFVTTEKDFYKVEEYFRASGTKLLSCRITYQLPQPFLQLLEAAC